MNPFTFIQTGLFAATGSGSANNPSLAECICAAVCKQILQNTSKLMDGDEWATVISQIPFQITTAQKSTNKTLNTGITPAEIAGLCLPQQSKLTDAVASALAKLQGNLSQLICFSVTEMPGNVLQMVLSNISITPTFHGLPSVSVSTSTSSLSFADATQLNQLTQIFGTFTPPVSEDYFITTPV